MKNKSIKQWVSSLVMVCMLFSSFGVAFGAPASATAASDIKSHWAETQITAWVDKGIIKGYEDGSFKPDNTITRAEFMALINRSFGFTEVAAISFSDVAASNWAYAEAAKAVKAGYITGYADGTIGASKAISRQEVAVIVDRLLGLTNTESQAASFSDSASIALWAKGPVDAAVAKGILKGYAEDNSFKPSKSITRAEAVVTLDRAIAAKATVYNAAGTYGPATGTETINGDVVINVAGTILQNLVINGNLLFAAGIGSGDATLNNVTVKGQTKVEGGGENSIHFNNSVILTILVNKKNGTVRIVAEGSTTVGEVTIQSSTTIQEIGTTGTGFSKIVLSDLLPADSIVTLKGMFDSLDIKGRQIQVNIPEGSVKEVIAENTSTGLKLTLGTEAKIINFILNAAAKIFGTGTIDKVTISLVAKDGTTFEKPATETIYEGAATPTPVPTTTPVITTPDSGPTPPTGDQTAPILSNVTSVINVGGDVTATSNEAGYIYLVPKGTVRSITALNNAVNGPAIRIVSAAKLPAIAGVPTVFSTNHWDIGTYVVFAVDNSNNISTASADIIVKAAMSFEVTYSDYESLEIKVSEAVYYMNDDVLTPLADMDMDEDEAANYFQYKGNGYIESVAISNTDPYTWDFDLNYVDAGDSILYNNMELYDAYGIKLVGDSPDKTAILATFDGDEWSLSMVNPAIYALDAVNDATKNDMKSVLVDYAAVLGLNLTGDYADPNFVKRSRQTSVANYVFDTKVLFGYYQTSKKIQDTFNAGISYEKGKLAFSEKVKAGSASLNDLIAIKQVYVYDADFKGYSYSDTPAALLANVISSDSAIQTKVLTAVNNKFKLAEGQDEAWVGSPNPYKINDVLAEISIQYSVIKNAITAVNAAGDKAGMETALESNAVILGLDVTNEAGYANADFQLRSRQASVAQYVLDSKPAVLGYVGMADIQAAFNAGLAYEQAKLLFSTKLINDELEVSDFTDLRAAYEAHGEFRGEAVRSGTVYVDAIRALDKFAALNDSGQDDLIEYLQDWFNQVDGPDGNAYKINTVFEKMINYVPVV